MPRLARLLVLVVALAACSQRVTPEEEWSEDDRDRPLLPAGTAPAELQGGPSPAAAGMRAGDAPAASAPSAAALRGVVEAPTDPGAPVSSEMVLFLLVRAEGVDAGPPLAVQRHAAPALPFEFAIGPESAMIPGTEFPARVTVEARLDQDGDASTRGPGDVAAKSAPVAPGTAGLALRLEGP